MTGFSFVLRVKQKSEGGIAIVGNERLASAALQELVVTLLFLHVFFELACVNWSQSWKVTQLFC